MLLPKSTIGCVKMADIFDAEIHRRVSEGATEVVVSEAGETAERLWALVRAGCVEALNWWAPASQS
jgi:hypothetical protein